jgi:hypothetical protein
MDYYAARFAASGAMLSSAACYNENGISQLGE